MNTDLLKQLREETGLSYSQCLKALKEANDDPAKAKELLREWGVEFAEKKSDRDAKDGAIFSYIHHNKKVGTLVELMCETDFVARSDDFISLGNGIAMQVASVPAPSREELLQSDYIKDPSHTVESMIKDKIFKLGENITLGRYERYEM